MNLYTSTLTLSSSLLSASVGPFSMKTNSCFDLTLHLLASYIVVAQAIFVVLIRCWIIYNSKLFSRTPSLPSIFFPNQDQLGNRIHTMIFTLLYSGIT